MRSKTTGSRSRAEKLDNVDFLWDGLDLIPYLSTIRRIKKHNSVIGRSMLYRRQWKMYKVLNNLSYDLYLRTKYWRDRRRDIKQKRGNRCQKCNQGGFLEVHHLTYENKGAEPDADLQVLCPGCHRREHATS